MGDTRVMDDLHEQYMINEEDYEIPKLFVENLKLKKFSKFDEASIISNESGYMSTPLFIQQLTEICNKVLKSEEKEKTLCDGI